MSNLFQWFAAHANLVALVVTVGVAVLLVSCLGCTRCSGKETDDLFKRHEV